MIDQGLDHLRFIPLVFRIIFVMFLVLCGGCGKRAEPEPPSLVVPSAITDLALAYQPGQRYLIWTLPKRNCDGSRPVDLAGFRLYRKDKPVGTPCLYCDEGFKTYDKIKLRHPRIGYVRGEKFFYPLTEPKQGNVSVFYVESLNSRGWASQCSNKLRVDFVPIIDPPAGLWVKPDSSVAELSWTRVMLAAQRVYQLWYNVYRRSPDRLHEWHCLTPEPLEETSYIDVGLEDWVPYEYAVTVIVVKNGQGYESRLSKVKRIVPGDYTPPSPVTFFTAFPYQGAVQLVWRPVTDADLAGYDLQRIDIKTGLKTNWIVSPSLNSYCDDHVLPGHVYSYRIHTFDRSKRRNCSQDTAPVRVSVPKVLMSQ